MTRDEKMIITAYTGTLMVQEREFHEWVEHYLGYPVWSHEFAQADFWGMLHERTRGDFIRLCEEETDG